MILWHPESPGIMVDVKPNLWHTLVGPRDRHGNLRFATLGEVLRMYRSK